MSKRLLIGLIILLLITAGQVSSAFAQGEYDELVGSHYAPTPNQEGKFGWEAKEFPEDEDPPAWINVEAGGTNPDIDGVYRIPLSTFANGVATYRMEMAPFDQASILKVWAENVKNPGEKTLLAIDSSEIPYIVPEGTKWIQVENLIAGEASEGNECHFVITDMKSHVEPPSGIYVKVATEPSIFFWVPLEKVVGNVAHYTILSFEYTDGMLSLVWTYIGDSWDGNFNNSHCNKSPTGIELVSFEVKPGPFDQIVDFVVGQIASFLNR